MAADDALILRLVRLVVATDWDAGFQLRANAEPLPDVEPGAEYVVECSPQRGVAIREVLVHNFQLVQISAGTQSTSVRPVARGSGLPRMYRLDAAITVPAGECVVVRLRNDATVPLKQKVVTLVREDAAAARIDPEPTGRAEDAVPCPACGKTAGDSCDGPASHPSRRTLYVERKRAAASVDGVVEDARVGNVPLPVGRLEKDPSASRCPTCDALVREEPRQLFGNGGARPYCDDAWHAGPIVHAPRITRTRMEGPGNAMLVRGCSCGAEAPSATAFADHVDVPVDAVRTILALAGIAYDLIDHPKKMDHADARRQIARCLEFTR
jgi:endogenous inhibitor of DNA gyrase (YacG/DUF329 family)